VLGVLAAAWASSDAAGASGPALVDKGNRDYAAGKYDEALESYEKASVEAPEAAQLYFNKGAAQFKKGKYEEAAGLFGQAALKTRDLGLEARSRYNQGNCLFRESERQRDSDLQKSLTAMGDAIARYQQALRLDPELKDSAHNIEVARLVMKQILDEIKKREEEAKKSQEQQRQQADKLQDLIKRQEALAGDTEVLAKEAKEKGESREVKQRADNLAKTQMELRSDTEKRAGEMELQKESPGAAKAAEHLRGAAVHQEAAARNLEVASIPEAGKSQQKALEEMKKAWESMQGGDSQGSQKEERKPEAAGDRPEPKPGAQGDKPQTAQPPKDEAAHDIISQEKDDREKRTKGAAGGYTPVDKDW